MEGTVEKDTTPIKETKTTPVKESKTAEVEPCVHNGSNECKTNTPEKVSNGNTPDKKTPEQGTKRKTEECSTSDDEIKKVKVTVEKSGEGDELSHKDSIDKTDELLKPAKKLPEDEVVSESGAAQEAC